ncbi:MAG: hypothetical protein ACXVCV_16830, partial [Polyangia bacterium]
DALAHFMRGLFRDEITEEHALVASMKAVDVAPFQDELDQATHKHTVTFARATGLSRIIQRSPQPSGSIRIPTAEQLLAHPQRRGLFIAGTVAALVAGGALAMVLAKPKHTPTPSVATNAPPTQTTPVVTPLTTPPPTTPVIATAPTPTRDVLPARHAARHHEKVNKVVAPPPHALQKSHTPEQVQAKFRTLKGEYAAFKSQYGPVLEDKWNAIATEITFGKADKFDKVDAMLDALRREMAKVRAGG